ncbi:AI-2E family transporter [Corynebacterium sputi]|uniref:AI-2E family transporter n=1 Tax=Corynebacterium sputi TaxID=489915 RepID=UPI0009FCACDE|nr:AI-2E family transporter [Corynebacterium sputi]
MYCALAANGLHAQARTPSSSCCDRHPFGHGGGDVLIVLLIAPSIRHQLPTLVHQFADGLRSLEELLAQPPFIIDNDQLSSWIHQATTWLESHSSQIDTTLFSGVTTAGSIAVTLGITLVLSFFFIKDGDKFLPWVRKLTGQRLGWHATELLTRAWNTLSGFIRAQAIVSTIDAIAIGLGLRLLGVPMAFVLAIITFFAGFVPIIGAVTAGFIAVLIALVSNGLSNAIMVLILILVIQQLEGNVLSPYFHSKAMELHAGVVLLSVAIGGGLFGIIGAFLAVPIAAVTAVIFRYCGDLADLRTGDKTPEDIQFITEEGTLTASRYRQLAVADLGMDAGLSDDQDRQR